MIPLRGWLMVAVCCYMYVAWSPLYAHPLPEGHRFPMAKYELIPQQLLYQGIITETQLHAPEPLPEEWILRTHDAAYWQQLKDLTLPASAWRKIGFPGSAQLVQREIVIAQGTINCAEYALAQGAAANVAGGTHHAYAGRGEGFCLLNDQAIAANWLLDTSRASRILIIDLDVHQGNGTAVLFQQEPRVFTFSMHGAANYPHRKEISDWDIALPTGTTDDAYLAHLNDALPQLFQRHDPDFVFYLSGVDVLATDKLGHLALTPAGVAERDRLVIEACRRQNLPIVACMGGGYSPRLADIVDAHCTTFRLLRAHYF